MSAGWVAGSTRATALARRALGSAGVAELAGCAGLPPALRRLSDGPYGRYVEPGHTLAQAEHGVAATLLWHLRVLAGWLPPRGVRMLRLLAGWFEIAGVEERLCELAGRPAEPPFTLGALATAGTRLTAAGSPEQVRTVLAASPWGDPGSAEPAEIVRSMRLSWADRLAAGVPAARAWAAGGAALLVAGELFVAHRPLGPATTATARRILGTASAGVAEPPRWRAALGGDAQWAVPPDPAGPLWRAQVGWWRRVRADGHALLTRPECDEHRPLGSAAVLAADAWWVRAALECAARGGTTTPPDAAPGPVAEVLDVLA